MMFAKNDNPLVLEGFIGLSGNSLAWIIVIEILFFGTLTGCCGVTKNEVRSPGGEYVARSEVSSCGAPTPFILTVTIRSKRSFSFPPWHHTIFSCDNADRVDLKWKGDAVLVVAHNCQPIEIDVKESMFDDIRIEYVFLGRANIPPGKLAPPD